ncbi:MAG: ABC transporter permease [Saprospiraceae bacterium]|nr:ABC transporter permease [Saprospiraceae bacterium]
MINLKPAFRQLSKNRLFAAINMIGLAVGVASGLLLFRIVQFEFSFNRTFSAFDRIVRVVTEEKVPTGEVFFTRGMPIPAMSEMENNVPQFETTSRVRELWGMIAVPDETGDITRNKFSLNSDGSEIAFFAEPGFLKIFDFEWLAGDRETALKEINSIVLTRSFAERCFGENWLSALEKTVVMDNAIRLTVKGIMADPPVNSDFPFKYLVSYPTLKPNAELYFYDENWGNISTNNQFFALLTSKDQFQAAEVQMNKIGAEQYLKQNGKVQDKVHHIQALAQLHFDDEIGNSGSHIVPKSRLWILSSIGILILLMACFNFINLSTAQAAMRAREVGVRKTLGSGRGQLVAQFLSETFLIVLVAVLLGAGLAALGAPWLHHISDVPNDWPFLETPMIWAFLGLSVICITFVSGMYPSLVLAGFNPIRALRKDSAQALVGGVSLRKVLVVGQFVIAQALIVGALIALNQLDYVQKKELGFDKNLVYNFGFQADSASQSRLNPLKEQLKSIPGVVSVSYCSDQPLSGNTWSGNFALGRGQEDAPFGVCLKFCDAEFQKTYDLKLVTGRWMEPSDTMRECVVNETLLRKLGVRPEEAIGKEMVVGQRRIIPIVGVVRDFHSHSLHEELEPMMLAPRKKFYSTGSVKVEPANRAATIASIEKVFYSIYPEQIFEGRFFDESIAEFYENEDRFANTCKGFAGLAILISCLGLFGLATHATARRTKEIGVRKVMGASVTSITSLLAKDFLKLVFLALLIATPLAWYFMDHWLSDFAFRIDIQWWVFGITGLTALLIAFITVSYQSIRAALSNPVKALRSE